MSVAPVLPHMYYLTSHYRDSLWINDIPLPAMNPDEKGHFAEPFDAEEQARFKDYFGYRKYLLTHVEHYHHYTDTFEKNTGRVPLFESRRNMKAMIWIMSSLAHGQEAVRKSELPDTGVTSADISRLSIAYDQMAVLRMLGKLGKHGMITAFENGYEGTVPTYRIADNAVRPL